MIEIRSSSLDIWSRQIVLITVYIIDLHAENTNVVPDMFFPTWMASERWTHDAERTVSERWTYDAERTVSERWTHDAERTASERCANDEHTVKARWRIYSEYQGYFPYIVLIS